MWCANDGVGPEPPLNFEFFGCAHVYEGKIPIEIHHEIFRFEISVDDSINMHMFHHE